MKIYVRKDSVAAGLITLLCVALLLGWLLVASLKYDSRLAAAPVSPELEEEEFFLDPELLLEQREPVGTPEAAAHDAPAPEVKGEPVPAPEAQPHTQLAGESQLPSAEPQLVTSRAESAVENAAPDHKKEDEKVAASMAGKFSSKPGSVSGKFDSAGSGGSATGVTGRLAGREFMGCPHPDVSLSQKTTVTVSIVVDADGKVTSASASGPTTKAIRRKCEEAAMKARWSAKADAPATKGTITFTIIPK